MTTQIIDNRPKERWGCPLGKAAY